MNVIGEERQSCRPDSDAAVTLDHEPYDLDITSLRIRNNDTLCCTW